jgi:hypothetical protein
LRGGIRRAMPGEVIPVTSKSPYFGFTLGEDD